MKTTEITHVPPGATGASVQVSVSEKFPTSRTPATLRGADPVFVRVIVFGSLARPTACFPNVRFVGLSFTAGATPLPVNATVWLPALSLRTS